MCFGKNQSKILGDGGDGAGQRENTSITKAPTTSVSGSQNIEARSSTGIKGTVPPSTQPPQPAVLDNARQRKDLNVSNTPKPSPVPNGFKAQNIVVLGPTGGGASSVFNLIAGKDVASVSNGIPRCTTEATIYPIELEGAGGVIQCILYDIPDFNSSPPSLSSGDINLAIVCMEDRTPQVKEAIHHLDYWENHNSCNMPVLVVINHMTPHPDPNWWKTNGDHFSKLRLLAGHVCLTRKERQKNTEELRSHIIELLRA